MTSAPHPYVLAPLLSERLPFLLRLRGASHVGKREGPILSIHYSMFSMLEAAFIVAPILGMAGLLIVWSQARRRG